VVGDFPVLHLASPFWDTHQALYYSR
jgi:hypothetical protein